MNELIGLASRPPLILENDNEVGVEMAKISAFCAGHGPDLLVGSPSVGIQARQERVFQPESSVIQASG